MNEVFIKCLSAGSKVVLRRAQSGFSVLFRIVHHKLRAVMYETEHETLWHQSGSQLLPCQELVFYPGGG